jgi:hypothetical protein
MYLKAAETTIVLHRLELRHLELEVTRNGVPVAGFVLMGTLAGCPCGACSGDVTRGRHDTTPKTDNNGVLRIPEFYPEEWEKVYFWSAEEQKIIWEADPDQWPKTGRIQVKLK